MAMTDKIELQNKEFDALKYLLERYNTLMNTAVVDDDYPEMRHKYESALSHFLECCGENGRAIKLPSRRPVLGPQFYHE